MATAAGLIIIKDMDYRTDSNEEWSNRYWFTGGIPADDTAWKAFADEIIDIEKDVYHSGVRVVRAYGYNDTSDAAFAVWTFDYLANTQTVPGELIINAGETRTAGDQAAMVWWRTARRNTRGKWVYLRKYFHGGALNPLDSDQPSPQWMAALQTLSERFGDGSLSNGRFIRSAHQEEVLTAAQPSPWLTTRTLKRRGKRPTPTTP